MCLKRRPCLSKFNVPDGRLMDGGGKRREWRCAGVRKALKGLNAGPSHSCYSELQQPPSTDFTPQVSEDSTPGDRLPQALQAKNTGSITPRRMGSVCSAAPDTEVDF